MKIFISIPVIYMLLMLGIPLRPQAQEAPSTFQLKQKLKRFEKNGQVKFDTAYANTVADLAYIYSYSFPDSALALLAGHADRCRAAGYKAGETDAYLITADAYQTKGRYQEALANYEKAFLLASTLENQKAVPVLLNRIGVIHLNQGNYPQALQKFYASLKAAEALDNKTLIGATLNNIANVHYHQGKFDDAEKDYQQRLELAVKMSDTSSMSVAYNGIGEANLQKKELGKALYNLNIAHQLAAKIGDQEMLLTVTLSQAEAFYAADSLQQATNLFRDALARSKQKDNGIYICNALIGLAKVFHKQGFFNEALTSGSEALQRADKMGQVQLMRDANEILSRIYEAKGDGLNALKHYRLYKTSSDSLNNLASQRAVAIEKESYEFSKKELAFERETLQQRWLTFSAFAGLISLGILLFVIYRSKSRLNITNLDLQHKNTVIEAQRIKAEETLSKLKAAQSQLIQAEKMASLGELTAGIAHEIQNPLNFVNNFSEVSNELVDEMNEELDKGFVNEARSIASDIRQNLEKVIEHGKRADAIVKGMLLHSRGSTGVKEITNLNKLADEYIRLSTHGWRTKDKTLNATVRTNYDESLRSFNLVPQDIGRVVLNLVNNAFYAVGEKKRLLQVAGGTDGYEATILFTTRVITLPGGKAGVSITVEDNGNGIPQNMMDKIFQPFFTTKPSGQGTGLGLSLSYDIVKAHGGELKVESQEGIGTIFSVLLPVTV
ncbi:MAG: tetratricopeptide repeat protein [Ferruginibacter sp.]|nr:tetratricopeptide repeat protein [Ferruginibacter sp.]